MSSRPRAKRLRSAGTVTIVEELGFSLCFAADERGPMGGCAALVSFRALSDGELESDVVTVTLAIVDRRVSVAWESEL